MPKFTFDSDELGRAFGIAKVVKPMAGDFAMRFDGDRLTVYSSDKRRYARAEVSAKSVDSLDSDYKSEEFYVAADRQTLLDSDLSTITISVGDKGISVRAEGDGQTRNATLKKRSDNSRRPPIPTAPDLSSAVRVKARLFEELLRQVSCSAQVKETKTDEDMKVNQVHFYSQHGCAMSTARFFGSAAMLPGLGLDLSVVSADLPTMRAFCSRLSDADVLVHQDKSHMYLGDPQTGSFLCFSRVASNKPPFSLLSEDGYDVVVHADQAKLVKALQWANMAIEGTQRLSIRAADGLMEFKNGSQEVSQLPVEIPVGTELKGDFPVRILQSVVGYFGEGNVALKYGHRDLKTVLEISEAAPPEPSAVRARHFLQSMKER